MNRFIVPLFLGLTVLAASAQTPAAERLRADLMAGSSATQVLTQWCGRLAYADAPLVLAARDPAPPPVTEAVRAALDAGPDETVASRRVRLTCGGHVLSVADNWYLPARLTPAMNRALEETDTSFGTVVRPLNFHRRTLEAAAPDAPGTILRVRAVLETPDNRPFSLVVENYTEDLAR